MFRINAFLFKAVGIRKVESVGCRVQNLVRVSILSVFGNLATMIPAFLYVTMNFSDVSKVSDALYGACAYFIIFSEYIHLVLQSERLADFLDALESLAAESVLLPFGLWSVEMI